MGLDSETGLAGAIVEQRRYSKEDVTKHNNQKDLWITIHNKGGAKEFPFRRRVLTSSSLQCLEILG